MFLFDQEITDLIFLDQISPISLSLYCNNDFAHFNSISLSLSAVSFLSHQSLCRFERLPNILELATYESYTLYHTRGKREAASPEKYV